MTLPSNYALERSVTALSQRIARPRSTRAFGAPCTRLTLIFHEFQ